MTSSRDRWHHSCLIYGVKPVGGSMETSEGRGVNRVERPFHVGVVGTLLPKQQVRPSHDTKRGTMGKIAKKTPRKSSLPKARGLCLRCGEIKSIYKTETVCEDCWMSSIGQQEIFVSCPKEVFSSPTARKSSSAIRPLKACYHCPYRKGWDRDDSPQCGFPGPVVVLNTPDGKRAMCPRNLAREGCGVNLDLCRVCEEHAWIEETLDGIGQQWVYCSLPRVVHVYGEGERRLART